MPDRYYSETTISGPTVTLAGSEAHHLLHVMRAKTGLQLVVFDGKGGEYDATVARCDRREVELEVGSRRDVERELPWELTLAVALPKGDRQRWLVEKAVELGVTQLVPLKTARTVTSAEQSAKLARYVISASKQCGRNRLMPIGPLTTWPELVRQQTSARRLLAHPGGSSELKLQPRTDTWVAVGPEGGFTEEEAESAVAAGWENVSLGSRILRIETAALALVSAIGLGEANHRNA